MSVHDRSPVWDDGRWAPLEANVVAAIAAMLNDRQPAAVLTPPLRTIVALIGAGGARAGTVVDGRVGVAPVAAGGDRVLLWSVSKTILAATVFRLVEGGRLSLDGRVADLLPAAPVSPGTTVRHLLSHTAGVPDYGGWPDYHEAVREQPGRPWATEQYLRLAHEIGAVGVPGERWVYSNIGYLLVRQVIARVSGEPVERALDRLLFRPLSLQHMGLSLEPDSHGPVAFSPAGYHPGWVAHGVVSATLRDTARFFDLLLGGQVLSPASLRQLTTPVVPVAATSPYGRLSWAAGTLVGKGLPAGTVVGHTGGGPGSTTAALRVTSVSGASLTVAVATNDAREQGASEIAMRVADVLLGTG